MKDDACGYLSLAVRSQKMTGKKKKLQLKTVDHDSIIFHVRTSIEQSIKDKRDLSYFQFLSGPCKSGHCSSFFITHK